MKASDITPGDRVELAVVITPGPSTPRMKARQHATVVAIERSTVTVEVTEPVCTNLDDHAGQVGWAMANGLLHWEHQPVTRTVRAADVVARIHGPATAPAMAEVAS